MKYDLYSHRHAIEIAQNKKLPDLYNCSIAILGIGYVGLPLAIHFTKVKSCLSTKKKLCLHSTL